MPRRVQEGDVLGAALGWDIHSVGADGLRDAARLPERHLGLAHIVQQRRLRIAGPHQVHTWASGDACRAGVAQRAAQELTGASRTMVIHACIVPAFACSRRLLRRRAGPPRQWREGGVAGKGGRPCRGPRGP